MFEMDDLYKLMELGWNINIECKGKGREYEMSFEGHASKIVTEDMTDVGAAICFHNQVHAYGDTMKEIVDILTRVINDKESKCEFDL